MFYEGILLYGTFKLKMCSLKQGVSFVLLPNFTLEYVIVKIIPVYYVSSE
jgi:hypothetical protein